MHDCIAGPTGHSSGTAMKARGHSASRSNNFQAQVDGGSINAGTPKQAIARLRAWLQETRPGILMLWAHDGGLVQRDAGELKNALFCRALRCRQQSAILASHPGPVRWKMAELTN